MDEKQEPPWKGLRRVLAKLCGALADLETHIFSNRHVREIVFQVALLLSEIK
jgi:hypothetical protein